MKTAKKDINMVAVTLVCGASAVFVGSLAFLTNTPPEDQAPGSVVEEVQQVQEKTPEQLAAENAKIDEAVFAATKEAGPQNTKTSTPSTFEEQLAERYSVTMTESEAFSEICNAAHTYIADGATNLQAREEVRAYADYLAPKTGNPGLRTPLAQHGINCLY